MAVDTMCYTIFARVGTLPAAKHLSKIIGDKQEYIGPSLGLLSDEFLASYADSFSTLGGGHVLTEFQKSTEMLLEKQTCGILSAPTSAGKSFIIHEYVKAKLRNDPCFVALFIVPTKALITQTCSIYRRWSNLEGIELIIKSSVPEDMETPNKPTVFVLTQERCVRLLNMPIVKSLSLVFADEIQSLENEDRGALLEYVLYELRTLAPQSHFFAAGPFIANSKELGLSLLGEDCKDLDTKDTPVSQMVVQISPVRRKKEIELCVEDPESSQNDHKFTMETKHSFYSKWKSSSTEAVCDAIHTFANNNSSIVYAKGPGTAQRWAKCYNRTLSDSEKIPIETKDLIAYLHDSIHPNCSLIQCLKRRIAYHHGGLPDFVREEIEELFIQGEIDILFCTSTLLEGVNLPADKIFIAAPNKADDKLTPFEFKNLAGRAGRLDKHLYGTVYCICIPRDDNTNLFDEFRGNIQKEVLPTIDNSLATSYEAIHDILAKNKPMFPEEGNKCLRSTVTILRSRFLRGRKHAEKYLATKKLTDTQKDSLLDVLNQSTASLKIPSELALKNPYVDPILQNLLYCDVVSNTKKWSIRRDRGFSTDLEVVFKFLDDIFHIISEISPIGIHEYYRNDLLTFAKLWLHGKSFKEIVNRALPSNLRHNESVTTDEVDKAIEKAMDFITKDISFIMAKYFSVLADIISTVVSEDEIDDYAMTRALPAMLELGCSDPKTLALITACVPRGAAIQLSSKIPDEVEDPVTWLTLHQDDECFRSLSSIYRKILNRCGIWK